MTPPFAKRFPLLAPYSPGASAGSSSSSGATEGAIVGQVPALQLAKQNFIIASGDFSNGAWTTTGTLVVTANSTLAPNGVTQADTLNDNDAAATATIQQAVTIPNDLLPYTASCYFTAGTSGRAQLKLALSGGVAVTTSVDFAPGTGAQLATSGIGTVAISASLVNGVTWIRVAVTATNNASGNTVATLTISPASTALATTGTVIAWGAQVEQNSVVSDLIRTDVTSVTRRAGRIPPYLQDASFSVRQATTNLTLDSDLHNGALVLAASSCTITLPGITQAGIGWQCRIKQTANGVVTVQGSTATDVLRAPGALGSTVAITLPFSGTSGAGPFNVSGGCFAVGQGMIEMVDTLEAHGEIMVTTNGSTFIVPAGVNTIWVDASAGGGGGGGVALGATTGGGGASAGACALGTLISVVPGAAHTIAVGIGGNGGSAGANNGANGGSTALGALITVPGGLAGSGAAATALGQGGSSAGFGSGPGGRAIPLGGALNGNVDGGFGGGNIFSATAQTTLSSGSTDGVSGIAFGGGGEGAQDTATAARAGGKGADGFIRIRW